MTTGPVDLKLVGDRLQIVAACVAQLRALPTGSLEDFKRDFRNSAAAGSLLRENGPFQAPHSSSSVSQRNGRAASEA